MLSYFNSREREKHDWQRICQEIDPRLKFKDAWVPKGSALGIIEAVWEPEFAKEVDDAQMTAVGNGANGTNEAGIASYKDITDSMTSMKDMGLTGTNGINV